MLGAVCRPELNLRQNRLLYEQCSLRLRARKFAYQSVFKFCKDSFNVSLCKIAMVKKARICLDDKQSGYTLAHSVLIENYAYDNTTPKR